MRHWSGIAAAAFVVWLLLGLNAPASATCYHYSQCDRYESGQCVHTRYWTEGCDIYGNAPSEPSYSFGAIAYGRKSGAYGYSHRWGSRAKAESVAQENCAEHGDDCEIMVWFDRKCGAVVASEDADTFWGLGDSEAQANANAQNKCAQAGSSGCALQVSHCSN